MTIAGRRSGWLTDTLHGRFREILLHTQHRESLICPGYTLMPDHLHLVWIGCAESSEQLRAAAFLRRYLNDTLEKSTPPCELQLQGHDRVLREQERGRDAFQSAVHYVFQNPVRSGLVERAEDWPYSGTLACGYPDLDWRDETFWDRFWKVHAIEVGEVSTSTG